VTDDERLLSHLKRFFFARFKDVSVLL